MDHQNAQSNEAQKPRDPDLEAAGIALERAARKARERAKRVGAGVVVWKEGRLMEEQQESSDKTGFD